MSGMTYFVRSLAKQHFDSGPWLGLGEMLACGAISQAFYDEIPKEPGPSGTVTVASVDRKRGIVTVRGGER